MRETRLPGPLILFGGIVVLAYALVIGQATVSLVLVFPIVTASGPWGFLGVLLIVTSFAVFFLTWPFATEIRRGSVPPGSEVSPPVATSAARPRRWGGVVFLGPIPIVFGSDAKVARWMLLVGIVLFVALLVLTLVALQAI